MYLEHYGLSERHRDALAHLLFGITQGGGGGFVQLTGEVGTGKTTLCRLLLEQVPQLEETTPTRVALVLNPRLTPVELLETVCEELHLDLDGLRGSAKALVDALNAYLLDAYAQGLRVVLVIDEAQNLSVEALEQVRLLTNLETPTQKLLQIVLLAQPELRRMLAREDMRQLAQRITARFHLTPLDAAETGEYLRHRFRIAGGQRFPFDASAVRRIHLHSGGVPRLINAIAERSLLAGYAHDVAMLDARWVDRAAAEVLPSAAPRARSRWAIGLPVAAALLVGIGVAGWWWWTRAPVEARPAPATPPAIAPAKVSAPAKAPPVTAPAPAPAPALDAEAFAAALRAAPVQPGSTGPVVDWIRERLQPGYLPATDAPAVFDDDMQAAVRRFQRDRGLLDDGLVGPATLMALASRDDAPLAGPAREGTE